MRQLANEKEEKKKLAAPKPGNVRKILQEDDLIYVTQLMRIRLLEKRVSWLDYKNVTLSLLFPH